MNVVVLGAGVVGITTAYYLAHAGAIVTVIDRQPGPALETSFANGGQISANHVTPWATPGTPWKALAWLEHVDAPLLLHLRYDPALARWLVRFLRNCTRRRMQVNIERALRLALYSRAQLAELRRQTAIAYDQSTLGILHIFRSRQDFEEALPGVELMNRLGCERHVVDVERCIAIEPALAHARDQLVGGVFSPGDESGDAQLFSARLAEICERSSVRFRWNETIRRLHTAGRVVTAVETDRDTIEADTVVVALGSYSPQLLAPLGIPLPVYPGKGYSVTVPVAGHAGAPAVSLIDDAFKIVYSRLGDRLRIAGTAEFIGYDASINQRRARFLLSKAVDLFPDCGDIARAAFWAGLRPSTPDGVPVIGRTRFDNLLLNTGHGTLGWTMACGSGRVVADLVLRRTPDIALDGLGIERFG